MKRSTKLCLFLTLIFGFNTVSYAQTHKILWADSVMAYSSQYSSNAYSAQEALGAPSVLPALETNTTAWSPRWPDKGAEHLTVRIPQTVEARQVIIAQSFHPGAVEKVVLSNETGDKRTLKMSDIKPFKTDQPGILAFMVRPAFNTSIVTLHLNTDRVKGYNHIDAIGLSNSEVPYQYELDIAKDFDQLEPKQLPSTINSAYDDLHPIPSADGHTLYFTRKDHPQNYGRKNLDDIYVAHFKDSTWSIAENVGTPLNTTGFNHANGLANNAQRIYCAGHISTQEGDDKLYHADREGETWSTPKQLKINNFYNQSGKTSYHLTADEQVMILSLVREDSRQSKDLYVSFRKEDATWTPPVNLGGPVNTVGDEVTPYLAADGRKLYFASNGHAGYGKMDIYLTQRLDDSWTNWSQPLNLGSPINSEEWEAYFSEAYGSGDRFFTRYVAGHKTDIFQVQKAKPVVTDSASFTIKVVEAGTQQPLQANVTVNSGNQPIQKSGAVISLQNLPLTTSSLQIEVAADGYFSQSLVVDSLQNGQTLTVALYTMQEGVVIPLKNIFFEANKMKLKSTSFPELNNLARFLRSHKEVKIEVAGHTNDLCSSSYCKRLSTSRAKAVADYLTSKGVPQHQVTYKGYGKQEPIASNETEAGRQQNQRVEVRVLEIEQTGEKEKE